MVTPVATQAEIRAGIRVGVMPVATLAEIRVGIRAGIRAVAVMPVAIRAGIRVEIRVVIRVGVILVGAILVAMVVLTGSAALSHHFLLAVVAVLRGVGFRLECDSLRLEYESPQPHCQRYYWMSAMK